jgi:hypothetical protein
MIKNPIYFENAFTNVFGDINRTTLSNISTNRLRFELAGENESSTFRIKQAVHRSFQILNYCFKKELWLRIILWDKSEEIFLKDSGLNIHKCNNYFSQNVILNEEKLNVLYFYYQPVDPSILNIISTLIINYDLAKEPSENITCFFIDLQNFTLANIYDDRGMDVYSPVTHIIDNISSEFSDWKIT